MAILIPQPGRGGYECQGTPPPIPKMITFLPANVQARAGLSVFSSLLASVPAPGQEAPADKPAAAVWTTQKDHQNMLDQLGITRLRPGVDAKPGTPRSANYDPAKANPFPDLPDPLTLKEGKKVTTPAMWMDLRRPEIVEDFEREIFGRIPKSVPRVGWKELAVVKGGLVGTLSADGRQMVGIVDNAACPSIPVEIQMTVVTPADAKGPVPLVMMFGGFRGGSGMPRAADAPLPEKKGPEFGGPYQDPPSTEQLIAAGWGYAIINPGSIQPDNGAGLRQGNHRLDNKGSRASRTTGVRCGHGPGAPRGAWTIWKRDPAVDASRSASKACRVMAKPRWWRWRSSRALRWCWWALPAKAGRSCTAAILVRRWRT